MIPVQMNEPEAPLSVHTWAQKRTQ